MTSPQPAGTPDLDLLCIDTIRTLAMDAVEAAQSGHPGTPMALAPLAYLLYTRHLRHDPHDPAWPDRDRFVLSAGHASMLLYATLHLVGYDLPLEEIRAFRQWGSRTPGHPEHGLTPGVETTTGPLGQGLSNAVGMALAEAHLAARFNRDGHTVVDHRTYVVVSDGDLMEGISHEAAALAGHLALGKLIAFYDDNHITIEGPTSLAYSDDVAQRFAAYGWHVQRVADGNDLAALGAAAHAAEAETSRPSLVLVRTHIGWGSPHKQDSAEAHGAPLGKEEVALAKRAYGWPEDRSFFVPDEARRHAGACVARGAALHAAWLERLRAYEAAHPDLAAEWRAALGGELPAGWEAALPAFGPTEALATRAASGKVINALAPVVRTLIGGSADLAPSTNTLMKSSPDLSAADREGRNLHFGIRELGMCGVLNGMALHGGVRPYGATFLVFSDYARPAIRLAALMRLPVIYVFTHDSIGLGEDGPTHQPVEHLAALRAIPGLAVIRPADGEETVAAWRAALLRRDGPTALVLTRQKLPALARSGLAAREGVERGGYVLEEASGGAPRVILMGTGSEVQLCVGARALLEKAGVPSRVVSLPSLELFEAQPAAYREAVLPPAVPARVAVEAARTFGWHRWVGDAGDVVGLDHFGASAPAERLFAEYGFSAERVAERARALLRQEITMARTSGPVRPASVLAALGQSLWLDYIHRDLLDSGELKRLIEQDGIRGVTSNPTIFEQAITKSATYDESIAALAKEGKDARAIFDALAIEDITRACDVFRPIHEMTGGGDGFVSIEVAPDLANDTARTIAEARRLWAAVGRPNVMVKVPGTAAGLPAITQLTEDGVNVNITLLFAVSMYQKVIGAWLTGLERRAAAGRPLEGVRSVASFFVSRVDSEVDPQLEARVAAATDPGQKERLSGLLGTAAVDNAVLAYQTYLAAFGAQRFRTLMAKGAAVQRPLWASTSTKNPRYPDTMYVDRLIGPDTVNTIPPATLRAFQDHGKAVRTIDADVAGSRRRLASVAAAGISLADVTAHLERDGVKKFTASFTSLLDAIDAKRAVVAAR